MQAGNRFRDWRLGGKLTRFGIAMSLVVGLAVLCNVSTARAEEETTLRVVVKDAANDEPIFQAHLTLQFRIPQKYRQDKWISYSAKTDKKGECTFRHITKGPIRLMVTAEGHQSYGKKLELEKDDAVIEVKLRKPQPQI